MLGPHMGVPNFPSALPFRQWGLVPSACVLSGLPVLILGAVGEISISNRKLMLGCLLLSFGAMWHYARRVQMRRSFLEGAKAIFFFVVASLAGYCLAYGRLPHR